MPRQPKSILRQFLRKKPSDPFIVVTLTNPADQFFGQEALVIDLTASRLRLRLQLLTNHHQSITRTPLNVRISQISLDRRESDLN